MIRRQVTFPVPPERLWEALTDPAEASQWLGGQIEWTVEEGSPLHFVDGEGPSRHGRVDLVRPGRYLKFVWWPDDDSDEATEVSYLLEPEDDGSRLTIQEQRATDSVSFRADGSWTSWDTGAATLWTSLASTCMIGA